VPKYDNELRYNTKNKVRPAQNHPNTHAGTHPSRKLFQFLSRPEVVYFQ